MKVLLSIVVVILYFVVVKIVTAAVKKVAQYEKASAHRIRYINKTLHIILGLAFLSIFFLSLGIEFAQLSLFLSSAFAIIGVALFAQWSILSNITASLIIFFAFPYRVGDVVQVVDKDDDISGVIEEISLFHVIIRRGEDMITYPNSLILQKAVIKKHALDELSDQGSDSEEKDAI